MISKTSAADYFSLILQSGLLSAAQLEPVRAACEGLNATDTARKLVRERLLTPFQARQLLAKRPKGFFLGDKFKILEHIGSGGMGRVYLCEHLLLQRLVAIKVLQLNNEKDGSSLGPGAIERFYREARAVASLDHALWFHRPFRADDWLLYSIDSPSAQNARGLARGMIYDLDGRLVASTAQEGLIRVVPADKAGTPLHAKG